MLMPNNPCGRVAVLGAGPAGMAAALSTAQAGHEVAVYERYREARPAGNILNLWPPPLKALRILGVDTEDLGSPTDSEFRNLRGHVRAHVRQDPETKRAYGGGFIGLLRPELYERMLAAIPPGTLRFNQQVTRIEQNDHAVTLNFADGTTAEHDVLVGADGIDSLVRRTLWGDTPKREHRLHIFGGFTFTDVDGTEPNKSVLTHSRTVQGSWTSIRHKGRDGFQWWVLTATDPDAPAPSDLKAAATALAAEFPAPLPGLIAQTEPDNVQRWVLRDRPRLQQWSKGRSTLVGDAAHPTSPTPPTARACPSRTATSSAGPCAASTSATSPPYSVRCKATRTRASPTPPGRSSRHGFSARSSTTRRHHCGRSATSSSTTPRFCRRSPATPTPAKSRSNWPSSRTDAPLEGIWSIPRRLQ